MIVPSQWLLLAGWAVVIAVFTGWGALVRWLWRAPVRADPADLLRCFWLGWAAVLLGLQLWHFAFPVAAAARWLVAGGGLLGLSLLWRPLGRLALRLPRALPVAGGLALAALFVSNRALDGARFGDTGGYYVPTIRWMIEYPVVTGLANLYPPYAYNQSYFLYAALLDGGPFAGRTHHLLNSTLVAVLAARTLLGLWRLRRRDAAGPADVFWALMLPAEIEAATGFLFTSPAPDFGVYALGIALSGELVGLLAAARWDPAIPAAPPPPALCADLRMRFLSLALLAALAPTVKLPIVGLAALSMLVGLWAWIRITWRATATMLGGVALAGAFGIVAIAPWIAGNVLMSGCPLFPSAAGALAVPWRVDWDVQQWIQNTMVIGDWSVALRSPGWVAQRFAAFGWTQPSVTVPAGIAGAALLAGAAAALVRRRRRHDDRPRLPLALLLPPLASLAFCIATTPVPRYAGATMWLLAAYAVLVALGPALLAPLARAAVAMAALLLSALPFLTGSPLWLDLRAFPPSPRPVVAAERLASGLEVLVPTASPACWDAPLPCTPTVHPGLRLRRPPDLAGGFEVAPGSGPPRSGPMGGG